MAEESTDSGIKIESPEASNENLQFHLVNKGIIRKNPDYNPEKWDSKRYMVDFDKAKALLQSPQAQKENSPVIFTEDLIKSEGEKSFKKVVKAFVDHGDIPTQLAVQIGRVVKPSNILIHDEDFARFLYTNSEFPESPEQRADLEIGTEYVNGWAFKQMHEAVTAAGVNLSNEQLFQLVLRNGVSHEYGHAIDRVILLLRQSKLEKSDDDWKEKMKITHEMKQSVYDTIAPREELKQLLEGQPEDGFATERKGTTSERIAVGFENVGTRYALEELEIDKDKIDQIMDNLEKEDKGRLDKSIQLINLLKSNSLTIEDLASARLDIWSNLKDQGQVELYDPLRFGLDTRFLGYFYPLTKNEVHTFVSQWLPKE